jgi:hypothetical protein
MIDRSRRRFFGALLGTAAAVPVIVEAKPLGPVITSGLAFDCIVCPACGNQQRWPTRHEFPTWEQWADHVTTPHQITCGNDRCQVPMLAQFARKVVDGKRV